MNNFSGTFLSRDLFKQRLQTQEVWDVIVIGGGATGLGTALDAASRGYSTLLLEQADFAKATSSRSTKLIHGGVRYLAQGNFKLVREALSEQKLLFENASHLVNEQAFVIPCYSLWSIVKYTVGLRLYDLLFKDRKLPGSKILSKRATAQKLPGLNLKGLKGGILYWDGQFDDSKMAIRIAQTCAANGGVLLNYFKVDRLCKDESNQVKGVVACDMESGIDYMLKAKTVINATGVFVDDILKMDTPRHQSIVKVSQGVHIVLPLHFMGGEDALLIPETKDGRVLFAVPWHGHLLVGTTDTPVEKHCLEPVPLLQEIDFILDTAGRYMDIQPGYNDILSVFAGLRPLAASAKSAFETREISRRHKLFVASSGLITITGGKWTTYRQMAEETVNRAAEQAHLKPVKCPTGNLKIYGSALPHETFPDIARLDIQRLIEENPSRADKIDGDFPFLKADVVWAIRTEMALTIEDVLARRLRVLFLNAAAAKRMAPVVADIFMEELGWDKAKKDEQVQKFNNLATNYMADTYH